MGLKSIEMQIAIPRSQDAGKMQEQMMRQGQQFQETLTEQQLKKELLNRTKVNEYEHVQTNNEEQDKKRDETQQLKTIAENNQNEQSLHPYLGKSIDYSG